MAVLKKRALAEYSQVIQEEPTKPFKRLRLAKKPTYVGVDLDKLKTTSGIEGLTLLIDLSNNLPIELEDVQTILRAIIELLHITTEKCVKVKAISLLENLIVKDPQDVGTVIEEFFSILHKETSHRLISQILSTLHFFVKAPNVETVRFHPKIMQLAKQNLCDSNHCVQKRCLILISELTTKAQLDTTFIILGEFSISSDPRVRTEALKAMLSLCERDFNLDLRLYDDVCRSLDDEYEGARMASLSLIHKFSFLYADRLVSVNKGPEKIRLADDAFGKICQMINDLSMNVRVMAASLMGSMEHVSPNFLEQTLDKKLMSNLRRKRTAHERQKESYTSGEWATGQKWADDAPKEAVDTETVSLMRTGACGAFVHGLEDEFMEVRSTSLDSFCQLAVKFPHFAKLSLDFLVDMFNDEIEDVRLKTIHSLAKISRHITLREDQLDTILCVLKDSSMDIREALHSMLGCCLLSTKKGLKSCVDGLLDNLKRYPQDKVSIWSCLQKLGAKHPSLTLGLVPFFLGIHPYLDLPEPEIEDTGYMSILILVFNAAVHCPTMKGLFEEYVVRHYLYLRDTLPHLVPVLQFGEAAGTPTQPDSARPLSWQFFKQVMDRLVSAEHKNESLRQQLVESALKDLKRLSNVEPCLSAAAYCASIYVESHLLIVSNKHWLSKSMISPFQISSMKSFMEKLLHNTFVLCHQYGGLDPNELAGFRQLRLRALALQLVITTRSSNNSTLGLCEQFLDHLQLLHKYLDDNHIQPEPLIAAMFRELGNLEEPKPGTVARLIQPLLQSHPSNLKFSSNPLSNIRRTSAIIHEPTGNSDTPLKFTAGLVLPVHIDVLLKNVEDIKNIRVKVRYADQMEDLIVPCLSDFRPLEERTDYRLYTKILLSHPVWSEACHVELSIVLCFWDSCKNQTIQLCDPVSLLVLPKLVRKGSIL